MKKGLFVSICRVTFFYFVFVSVFVLLSSGALLQECVFTLCSSEARHPMFLSGCEDGLGLNRVTHQVGYSWVGYSRVVIQLPSKTHALNKQTNTRCVMHDHTTNQGPQSTLMSNTPSQQHVDSALTHAWVPLGAWTSYQKNNSLSDVRRGQGHLNT